MKCFLAFVLLLLISIGWCQNICPPHCTCKDGNEVECLNIRTVPGNLLDSTVYLILANNFIGPILFKREIDLLERLPLRQLNLANNRITAIENTAFASLPGLNILDISGNNIPALTDDTFAGLSNLTHLFANSAGITDISSRAFSHIPNVIEIDLEENQLTTIGSQFGPLQNIQELLLAQNKINLISQAAFSGLNSLNHLSLFGNKLYTPFDSWFRDIVDNNGIIELDFRFNSSVRMPNPWLCCPDMALYYNYVKDLDKGLKSYPQLDLTCFWPVAISGRLVSTLSNEELRAVPCSDFTTTTVPPRVTLIGSSTVGDVKIEETSGNFLKNLNDAGAFFILLLFAVIGGCLAAGFTYWYKNKQGKQKLQNFAVSFRKNKNKPASGELTSKPYRQGNLAYGSADPSERPLTSSSPPKRPPRPARPAPRTPIKPPSAEGSNKGYSSYSMDTTDYSEEDVWNKT